MVSRHGYSEAFTKRMVQFRTWFPKDQGLKWAKQFTENSVRIMDRLQENIFKGVPFPLKKIDQVLVQNFEFSAMENWGMITYELELALNYIDFW